MEQYLPNCIESIINQTHGNWELILVDDGSPDNSGRIADDYAQRDQRIKVIHQKNAGVAAARNAAIEIASGEYTTFLDGDDFFHKDFLKDLLELAHRTKADIAQCGYVRGNERDFPTIECSREEKIYTSSEAFVADVAKIIVWGKLVKTEILKAIRIPEGRYFEDDLVTWRWYYAANRVVVTNVPYYYYTVNANSQMAQHHKKPNFSFMEAYDERIEFFRETQEKDLECCSHRQLCKSLLLTYGSDFLIKEQRALVLQRYRENWKTLKQSDILPFKLRALFAGFNLFPSFVSRLTNLVLR